MAYKCRKFVRRHRVGVLTGSIVVGALIVGFALATVGLIQANSARVALKIESEAAKHSHASAAATKEFLQQMLAAVDPDKALGQEVTVRYVLDEAAKKINEGALADQPEVEAEVRMTLGETYEGLGEYETAIEHLRAASDISHEILGDRDPRTLQAQRALAGVLRIENQFAAAEALLRRTAEMQSQILGDSHPDTLASMTELALALSGAGRITEAESIHRRTLQIQRRVLGDEHPNTLESMIHLGGVNRALGKLEIAEPQLREALQLCRRVHGEKHPQTAKAMHHLGLLLEVQRSHDQAEELFRRTYEVERRILGPDHPQTLVSMNNLLRVLDARGKVAERQPLIVKRLAHLERAAQRSDATAFDLHAYAWELLNSDSVDLRDHESALPVALRAVELDGRNDATLLETLATAHHRNGNLEHAIAAQREALAQARLGGTYNRADLEAKLVNYLMESGDPVGAMNVSWNNFAARLGRTLLSSETPGTALIDQADQLMSEARYLEAAAVLRGCLAIRQKELPDGDWLIADTQSQLGAAVAAGGKLSEAEPILLQSFAVLDSNRQVPVDRKRLAIERIIQLYQSWDKAEQVSKWRRRLDEVAGDKDRQTNTGGGQAAAAGASSFVWRSVVPLKRWIIGRATWQSSDQHPPRERHVSVDPAEIDDREFPGISRHVPGLAPRTAYFPQDGERLVSEVIRGPQQGTSIHEGLAKAIVEPLVENEERRC